MKHSSPFNSVLTICLVEIFKAVIRNIILVSNNIISYGIFSLYFLIRSIRHGKQCVFGNNS